MRVMKRRGYQRAIVAVARKMLVLSKNEAYYGLREKWKTLDQFEGESHARILAPVEQMPERLLAIANVYVLVEP